jgi:hypothetical protein
MNRDQAYALVGQTFTHAFDRSRFAKFAKNLLNRLDESKAGSWGNVKDAFKSHVQRYERLGTYTSPEGSTLDVLIVHLTDDSKLERARTAIRNFVADHLKARDERDAALVAFVSPSKDQWRFSYVKMDYATVEAESGRVGVEARLTPARRFSYIVGEGESCHTAQTRFLELLQDTDTNPTLEAIEAAFSVEAVTKEFFTQYAGLFGEINGALAKLIVADRAIRADFKTRAVSTVDFAKKLMGQIVFLYFLQKKGWLGVAKGEDWGSGPRDFLRRLAKGEYGSYANFFNDVLEPLFYATLATDRGEAAWSKQIKCRIPFLDGGLFEPMSGYDWETTDVLIPNRLFSNAEPVEEGITGSGILDVFDRYNFTVNEAEPLETEVAIDPEMLGKVFENLIEENRRKGLGAYYTPREIVHYMCQESLINYLDTVLNTREMPMVPPKARQVGLFRDGSPVQTALAAAEYEEIVPRAALETFVHLGEQISHYEAVPTEYRIRMPKSIEQNARLIDEKLAAITVCDPAVGSGAFPVGMMTEIVRARSTLTPYFDDIRERTPYHFKRHAIQSCLYGVDVDPGAVEIAKLRLWLSLVVDEEDVKSVKPLPNLDYKIVVGDSLSGLPFKSEKHVAIEQLKAELFDETDHGRKALLKARVNRLLSEAFASSRKVLGYDVNFDFGIVFSEVMREGGGFDVCIGNPPYVSAVHLPATAKERYKRDFRTAAGAYDVYVLFMEKALRLVSSVGIVALITPNKYLVADYARQLRRLLLANAAILEIDDFGKCKSVFDGSLISTTITFYGKPRRTAILRLKILSDESVMQVGGVEPVQLPLASVVTGEGAIHIYSDSSSNAILAKIGGVSQPLSRVAQVRTGVMGFDYWAMDKWIKDGNKGRRIATNSYVGRFPFLWGKKVHLYKREVFDPRVDPRCPVLSENTLKLFAAEKVVVRGVARRLTAALDEEGVGLLVAVHSVIGDEYDNRFLLGLLNSELYNWIHMVQFYSAKIPEGSLRYPISFLQRLPVRKLDLAKSRDRRKHDAVVAVVKEILAAKKRDADAETRVLEREIDRLVYELYGLTAEEVSAVESGSAENKVAESPT